MRPRKKILLVSASESVLAVRGFMLDTRGFRAVRASSAAEAVEAFSSHVVDAAVIDLDLGMGLGEEDGRKLVETLKSIRAEIPMILVSEVTKPGSIVHQADCFLGKGCCAPADLMERVKGMSMRKRGPRKMPTSVKTPEVGEVVIFA